MKATIILAAWLFAYAACATSPDAQPVTAPRSVTDAGTRTTETADASRVVSIGGSVTEIIYALGAEARLVGTDTSSVYPEAATRLPQVGYMRQISSEGVLSLRPSLVIAAGESGTPEAIEQIRAVGVFVLLLPADHTYEGAKRKIELIARALGVEEKGRDTIARLERETDDARALLPRTNERPRVLIVIARGAGSLSVSGSNTAADEMVRLAGGTNAVTDYEGYKPLTAEAVVNAAPDVVLFPTRGLESIGGIEGALNLSGIRQTAAGMSRRIVALDDLKLLGMTPRTGEAVHELIMLLHPELNAPSR